MTTLSRRRSLRGRHLIVVGFALVLGACAAAPPVLTTALVGFARDLIVSAAQNFAPQYASSTSNVMLALAETATGQPFTQLPNGGLVQAGGGGYGFPGDPGQSGWGQPGHSSPGWGTGYGDHGQAGHGQWGHDAGHGQPGHHAGHDPGFSQPGHHAGHDPGFSQPGHHTGYGPGYSHPGHHGGHSPSGYPPPGHPVAGGGFAMRTTDHLQLDVAVLVQRLRPDGSVTLEHVNDGDVLYGAGSPGRSPDKVRFFFRSNCDCYVYIVGVDSTAWVTPIFPRTFHEHGPVQAGRDYLIPDGNLWWALDEHQGVENIYFVLSRHRNEALEERLAAVPAQRPALPQDHRPVTVPAILMSRGLVLVEDTAPLAMPVPSAMGAPILPAGFASGAGQDELVITRWFAHE